MGQGSVPLAAILDNLPADLPLSALPPVTYSRERDFRLIRPLVYVTEEITRGYAESRGMPVIPCGCSQKTGTVRRKLRDVFADLEVEHPDVRQNLLSAMGNLEVSRLLDTRYLDLDGQREAKAAGLFTIV